MEVNPKPTPEGDVPGDYPGKTKPSRPFIGDVPGEGSEGPTDIPNKEQPPSPFPRDPMYRGQQSGRKGHFGSGHQKWSEEPDDVIPLQEWLGQTEPTHPNWDLPKFFSHPHAERKRANEGRADEPHPEPFSPEGQRYTERMTGSPWATGRNVT